jgi:ABC-2 type transport system permease protein
VTTVTERPARTAARESAGSSLAGTGTLLRFMLRRERIGLPIWMIAPGLLVTVQSLQTQATFTSPQELAELRATAEGNPSLLAMAGPADLIETTGGEVVFEIFSYVAVVAALMSMFLVTRQTRSDEEAGRAELVRAGRVGRRATLAAAVVLALLANVAVAVLVAVAGIATDLPATGSVLLGLAVAGVGVAFTGLTALAVQVFDHGRAVYGAVVAALGASWGLRAAGDVADGTLSWLSPIGWGQRTFPYVDDRWWPLLLPVGLFLASTAGAVALLDRRDLGAGLVTSRPGRPRATWALSSTEGLAWRLQRGSLTGWAAGLLLLGLAYGSFGEGMEDFVADNPEIAEFLPGGAESIVDSYFAVTLVFGAVLTAAYGVAAVLRARSEETSGRVEPLLATPTSRARWLAGHVAVALLGTALLLLLNGLGNGLAFGAATGDYGDLARLTASSLAYLPAVWGVVGVAVLAVGLLPRFASVIAWVTIAFVAVVAFFGESFELPGWLVGLSPLDRVGQVPLEDVDGGGLALLAVAAGVLMVAGFAFLRRRDLDTN